MARTTSPDSSYVSVTTSGKSWATFSKLSSERSGVAQGILFIQITSPVKELRYKQNGDTLLSGVLDFPLTYVISYC